MACDPRAYAGAAALLVAGGCATQGVPRPEHPYFARLWTEPPSSLLVVDHGPGAGRAASPGHAAPAAPPPPISPFLDSPVSFLIHGHFARGELVIVRVCLRPDRSIASSDVVESSGDRLFDQMAVTWAQRVRLRESAPEGRPIAPCGAVRVELRDPTQPAVLGDHEDQLG
jgi:hypothetical protein